MELTQRLINYSDSILKARPLWDHNRIIFGAPGTGKSHQLEKDRKQFFNLNGDDASDTDHGEDDSQSASLESAVEKYWKRVTFYPTYSYSQFVGSYKPVMRPKKGSTTGEEEIAYEFVPGPFLELLAEARKEYDKKSQNQNDEKPKEFLLIIEEINRANAAAVFGDMFQLLDRNDDYESEYAVTTTEDVRKYLAKIWELYVIERNEREEEIRVLDKNNSKVTSLKLPPNFYIWATMNSADQGVFPLDTAFKRRWEFEYLGLDKENKATIEISGGTISWDTLRTKINGLLTKNNVNEDKLLGPFFVKNDSYSSIPQKIFISKVLMYLWEDAARMCRKKVFNNKIATFSDLQKAWRNKLTIPPGATEISLSEIFLLDENDAKIEVERSKSWTTDHREQQNESPTNAAPQAGVSTEEETDSSAPSDPAPGES